MPAAQLLETHGEPTATQAELTAGRTESTHQPRSVQSLPRQPAVVQPVGRETQAEPAHQRNSTTQAERHHNATAAVWKQKNRF